MNPVPSPRPRVGIIGISGYGRIHLQLAREWAARQEIELAAAVVINPNEEEESVRLLRDSGCRLYAGFEAMFQEESGRLDLCLIPTGIAWHCRMTLAALRAGAHVLVEKPLSGSTAEGRAIQAASVSADRFVAVGFQDIYEPVARDLKARLVAGALGRIRSVRFLGLWPRPPSYFTRNGWAGKLGVDGVPVLDSPLNNAFAHFVNLGLFLAGSSFAESASARDVEAVLWRTNAIESFDTGVVRATTEAGVQLWFGASHACAATREPEVIVQGERGRAVWRHERDCVIECEGEAGQRSPLPLTSETRRSMMREVVAKLHRPDTFVCGPEMALHHTDLIERAHTATRIVPAPGRAEHQTIPAVREPIYCSRDIEARLFRAYDEGL
ncbi:MAG: Gfo/Idh/MocA family oxidoreductase, partial [Opitutaceae bacterium]|nr:Gfo/Idh/MocA family oxidoreductase [Opitutaceae bacterium]